MSLDTHRRRWLRWGARSRLPGAKCRPQFMIISEAPMKPAYPPSERVENRMWKSCTTLPDSLRMPLKVSQDVRSAMRQFNCRGYQGSNPQSATENGPISNRFPTFRPYRTVNHAKHGKTRTAKYPMNTRKNAQSVATDQMADRQGTLPRSH